MPNAVYCIAENRAQAETIVDGLKNAGFASSEISVLMADKETTREFAEDQDTTVPESAATGAGAGVGFGAVMGWLAGIGTLAIPGAGPFIAAGPIMAALSGAAVGAAVGGIAGALIGMGIPEFEARRYEGKVLQGNILISIHTENAEEIRTARRIL